MHQIVLFRLSLNKMVEQTVYRQVANISRTLVGNKVVDHSDVVSAMLQLHLHSRPNTWLYWIGQIQLQD